MTFTNRHYQVIKSITMLILVASTAVGYFVWRHLPQAQVPAELLQTTSSTVAADQKPPALSRLHWSVVRGAAPSRNVPEGTFSARFRLAGTFLEYGAGVESKRKAILYDTQTRVESLLSEGNSVDGIQVARILSDRVVLQRGPKEETLWLTFSGSSGGSEENSAASNGANGEPEIGVDSRFGGKRVGENRWVFDREKLMAYYRELMDHPDRLVKVFDSLHPLYGAENEIEGYQLLIEGEPEFFDAVGFVEGDIVRSVNSVDMTNRRRAEFFIRQFAEGKASAFVLKVDRDGQPVKLVYQVR